jgi:hypothetical protein
MKQGLLTVNGRHGISQVACEILGEGDLEGFTRIRSSATGSVSQVENDRVVAVEESNVNTDYRGRDVRNDKLEDNWSQFLFEEFKKGVVRR